MSVVNGIFYRTFERSLCFGKVGRVTEFFTVPQKIDKGRFIKLYRIKFVLSDFVCPLSLQKKRRQNFKLPKILSILTK